MNIDIKYCPLCKEKGILNELIFIGDAWRCDCCNTDFADDAALSEIKK